MKGMDIFCASQAATAISLTMEDGQGKQGKASSSAFPFCSSGRTIDRYNPIIRDPRRFGTGKTIPSSSQTTLDASTPGLLQNPRNNNNNNNKKNSYPSSSSSNSNLKTNNVIIKNNELQKLKTKKKQKSCTAAKSSKSNSSSSVPADFDSDHHRHHHRGIISSNKSWRCTTKPGDFISPPGSSRYLLSDNAKFLNVISDFDPVLKLVPVEEKSTQVVLKNNVLDDDEFSLPSPSKLPLPPPPPSSSSSCSQDQVVVVLRVSLHCRGCERKMRKHISRMEGVSYFDIDFAAKKVTVVGNVTPLGVLNSISKVKTAQLWNPSKFSTAPFIHQK